MTTINAVERAIESAGGQTALGKALGVTQAAIWIWVRRGWTPVRRARQIEEIFNIPAVDLINPDLAGVVKAKQS